MLKYIIYDLVPYINSTYAAYIPSNRTVTTTNDSWRDWASGRSLEDHPPDHYCPDY